MAMTTDEKLAAILAAVQTDPGNRGLARHPRDNLFTACPSDFADACRSIADHPTAALDVVTGFCIPTATLPGMETDGPLGAVFLDRVLDPLGVPVLHFTQDDAVAAVMAGLRHAGVQTVRMRGFMTQGTKAIRKTEFQGPELEGRHSHRVFLERAGPAADDRCYTMRGAIVTDPHEALNTFTTNRSKLRAVKTIGIGDGGNEIGMGKVPHETVVKNIPNGDLIHCQVATDYLIVAGVSNWGAYALAAGVYVVRGVGSPAGLFDPDREREILEVMVRDGPLVDGVTGKKTATVDGLSWDEYAKPLIQIGEILES
jgi:hypothetical protein